MGIKINFIRTGEYDSRQIILGNIERFPALISGETRAEDSRWMDFLRANCEAVGSEKINGESNCESSRRVIRASMKVISRFFDVSVSFACSLLAVL